MNTAREPGRLSTSMRPPLRGHDPPTFAKSHADAAAGLPGGIKRLENVLPLLGRDAGTVVGYDDAHVTIGRGDGDFNPTAAA